MKRILFLFAFLVVAAFAVAQTVAEGAIVGQRISSRPIAVPAAGAQNSAAQTQAPPAHPKIINVQQATPKPVKVTPATIRAAQQKLKARGFYNGPIDGQLTYGTRESIREFQGASRLKITGQLDAPTLTKLNIGSKETVSSAPGDVGRGGKALGQNVKGGHPVAGAKELGKGIGRGAKKVGQATKSTVGEGKEKVEGKTGDKSQQPEENPR